MNQINERVKEIREALELNQEAFGEKIGLVKSGVSNIESGRRSVNDRIIKLICQKFYVNEEWLRTGEGKIFKTEDDLYEALINAMDEIDDTDKKIILEYLRLPREHKEVFKSFFKVIAKE